MNTKIEFNHNKISRVRNISDMAKLLFPHNKRHQKVYLAIFVELKYAPNQFLPNFNWIAEKFHFNLRLLEIVRSKMRRMGIIDHVSRFNKKHGYREGWVFSSKFQKSLIRLSELNTIFQHKEDSSEEQKDRDMFRYL